MWWSLKFKVFKAVSLFKSENTMTAFGVCSRDIIFCSVCLFHFMQNLTFSVKQSNFPLDRTLGCAQNYFELKEGADRLLLCVVQVSNAGLKENKKKNKPSARPV